jgi:universal stress protein E|tara:strand:- start:8780 stop:9628 length:849 start_codon:yes stop_codon:yes gene_type:complete
MKPDQEKVFVVVDPTATDHIALQRAIITARFRTTAPKLYVFIAVDSESIDTRATNDSLFKNSQWFEDEIHAPLKKEGLDYQIEISWSSEWQRSILKSANRFGADAILLPIQKKKKHTLRLTFSESKWKVLKKATCPVILVRPGAAEQRKVILAAVNFQGIGDQQRLLNANVLTRGKWLAENYGAELHVVNAWKDSMNYPDRGKLAKETGLPSKNIHVVPGYTDEAVAKTASEINADLVIIGTLGQTGQTDTRRGNTAERVISGLDVDVVVVNTEYESQAPLK